jgi:hypothetical protein
MQRTRRRPLRLRHVWTKNRVDVSEKVYSFLSSTYLSLCRRIYTVAVAYMLSSPTNISDDERG